MIPLEQGSQTHFNGGAKGRRKQQWFLRCKVVESLSGTCLVSKKRDLIKSAFRDLAILVVTSLALVSLYDYFGPIHGVTTRLKLHRAANVLEFFKKTRDQAHCRCSVAQLMLSQIIRVQRV